MMRWWWSDRAAEAQTAEIYITGEGVVGEGEDRRGLEKSMALSQRSSSADEGGRGGRGPVVKGGPDHGMLEEGAGRGRNVVAVHGGAGGAAPAGRTVSGVCRRELCTVREKTALWCCARRHRHWKRVVVAVGGTDGTIV